MKVFFVLVTSEKSAAPKRPKVVVESGTNSAEAGPYVIISEALANFFGFDQKEMLQSEVLRRIWEYIKVNKLEVGKTIGTLASSSLRFFLMLF